MQEAARESFGETVEKTAIVCLAHGSRHPGTEASVARISETVAICAGAGGYEVHGAHLDFSARDLTVVAAGLRAKGYRKAIVIPLLFTEAFHLRHDMPAALARAAAVTGLEFQLAQQVGTGVDVVELLASRIPTNTENLIVYSVGSSVKSANAEVSEFATRVASRAGRLIGEQASIDATVITATGPGETGPDALLAAIHRASGSVHIAPLFISPGTLWDSACGVLDGIPNITVGQPLDVAIAPVVAARVKDALA